MKVVYGDEIGRWIEAKTGGSYDGRAISIGLIRDDGEILAGILYESWNGASMMCHMAAIGRLTREFLWVNADYAFRQIGVKKLIAPISSANHQMRSLAWHLGFIEESIIHDGHPDGDLVLMTLMKADCRFLDKETYGKTQTASLA